MGVDENKDRIREFLEDVGTRDHVERVDQYLTPDCVIHFSGVTIDVDGYRHRLGMLHHAFPDFRLTVGGIIAEGDCVSARWLVGGTHRGQYLSIPPTGKHITYTAMLMGRLMAGRLVELWMEIDGLGVLQQLGFLPTVERTGT